MLPQNNTIFRLSTKSLILCLVIGCLILSFMTIKRAPSLNANHHRKLLSTAEHSQTLTLCRGYFLFDQTVVQLDTLEHILYENHYKHLVHSHDGFYYHGSGQQELDMFLEGAYRKRKQPLDDDTKRLVLQHCSFGMDEGISFAYHSHVVGDFPLRHLNLIELSLFYGFLERFHSEHQIPFTDGNWAFKTGHAPNFERFVLHLYYQFLPRIQAIIDPSAAQEDAHNNNVTQSYAKMEWKEIPYGGKISIRSMSDIDVIWMNAWQRGERVVALCGDHKHAVRYQDYVSLEKNECPVCRASEPTIRWIITE